MEVSMKTFITILILFSGFTFILAQQDTSNVKDKNLKNQIQVQKDEMKQVQKSIGPKDNPVKNQKLKLKGKDVFIDKDGDGICDTRQSGMSFNKLRKRHGTQAGSGRHGGRQNGNNNSNGNGR